MHRTRLVSATCALLASLTLVGCGEQDTGPAGSSSRLSAYSGSASRQPASSSVPGLGRTPLTSGVAGDRSITDSVRAHYGAVPGAASLDDSALDSSLDPLSISLDSDLGADLALASLSDSSFGSDLGLSSLDDPCSDTGPIADMATVGTGDPELDAEMDDLAMEDPEFDVPLTNVSANGC